MTRAKLSEFISLTGRTLQVKKITSNEFVGDFSLKITGKIAGATKSADSMFYLYLHPDCSKEFFTPERKWVIPNYRGSLEYTIGANAEMMRLDGNVQTDSSSYYEPACPITYELDSVTVAGIDDGGSKAFYFSLIKVDAYTGSLTLGKTRDNKFVAKGQQKTDYKIKTSASSVNGTLFSVELQAELTSSCDFTDIQKQVEQSQLPYFSTKLKT